jgi:hypothetical protein
VALEPVGPEVAIEELADLVRDPGRHVDAVGERAHGRSSTGRPGQIDCHICRVTSPCSWLTPLTAPEVRSARAVMLNSARAVVVVARARGSARGGAEIAPGAGEVLLDELEGEGVVPGRHRACAS